MSYQILMDSCGDLSEGMRNNEHLRMIPLQIRVGQKECDDDAEGQENISINRSCLMKF